jgi:hypothetical protein
LTSAPRDTSPTQTPSFLSTVGFRAWAASIAGLFAIYVLLSPDPSISEPLSNVLPALTAGSAFVGSYLCLRKYGFGLRKRFQAVWVLLTLGFGLWVTAEVTWSFYYFVLNVPVPYPSVADVFYVSGYFPVIIGGAMYFDVFKAGLSRRRLAVAAISIAAAVSTALTFVVPVLYSQSQSASLDVTSVLYPVLDLTLVSLAILSLSIFYGGRIAKWWVIFGVAASLYVVADEYFVYQAALGTYVNGDFDDFIFLFAYVTFALAFYAHKREL